MCHENGGESDKDRCWKMFVAVRTALSLRWSRSLDDTAVFCDNISHNTRYWSNITFHFHLTFIELCKRVLVATQFVIVRPVRRPGSAPCKCQCRVEPRGYLFTLVYLAVIHS